MEDKVERLIENDKISLRQVHDLQEYLKVAKEFADERRSRRTKYYYQEVAVKLIDQRENDLIQFALERWKLPSENFNKFKKVDTFAAWESGLNEIYFLKKSQ